MQKKGGKLDKTTLLDNQWLLIIKLMIKFFYTYAERILNEIWKKQCNLTMIVVMTKHILYVFNTLILIIGFERHLIWMPA